MSHKLINHSPDLKKIQDNGFEIKIVGGFLLIQNVPYVNSAKQIARGTLVSKLELAGDKTVQPQDHVAYFIGDAPCDKNGNVIVGILNATQNQTLTDGVEINHTFSAKHHSGRYDDYYHKITTYINIISSHAEAIDDSVTAKTFKVIVSDEPDGIFKYLDTNSSRAKIDIISSKLKDLKIAIIGLGGTGSYVLDFVAKTWVKEIHLFDSDDYLQHNAFRSPGATSKEELDTKPKKVFHLHGKYTFMRDNIIPHDTDITSENLDELKPMNFVFICIDNGDAKKMIIDRLVSDQVPFVDAGIGIETVEEKLRGSVRLTTATSQKNDHISRRISFGSNDNEDYSQNIQIAELNALNAAFAVVKWKKLFGFYHDLEKEHHSIYNIDVNQLINDEILT